MNLVFVNKERPVTDSLMVAQTFGKRHDHVMRDIREMDCSKEFSLSNFGEDHYTAQNGQQYNKYYITQDGFSFLVMGYTGKEAARFKEMYINEFNAMKDELNKPLYVLPQTKIEAMEAYLEEMKKNVLLEARAKENEPKIALYDVAMQAQNAQPMNSVAKTLGIGRNKLFLVLREKKVLMHNNLPYQEFLDRGYFEVRQYSITHLSSGIENKVQTLVTAKGMAHIHKLIQSA